MKKFLIFIGGFVAGIMVTIFALFVYSIVNEPNDGLHGLTVFKEKAECITTNSQNKSSEIEILQVLKPNKALATIINYSNEKLHNGKTYRDYDIRNSLVVLLINYKDKTYYDTQKIDISNKCARQIGTYQYETNSKLNKTVPVVVIE